MLTFKFKCVFSSVNREAGLTDQEKRKHQATQYAGTSHQPATLFFDNLSAKNDLRHALSKLKPRKAPGPDKIHAEMLQRLVGKDVLLRLINLFHGKIVNFHRFGKLTFDAHFEKG